MGEKVGDFGNGVMVRWQTTNIDCCHPELVEGGFEERFYGPICIATIMVCCVALFYVR
jgi:hypothetical protein